MIYKVLTKGEVHYIKSGSQLSEIIKDSSQKVSFHERFAKIYIFCRPEDESNVYNLVENKRGKVSDIISLSAKQVKIEGEIPLSEIIENFNSQLKGMSQGYASYNYELIDFRPSNIVHLKMCLMDQEIDSFQFLLHKSKAFNLGK